jgi:hypothetical protein
MNNEIIVFQTVDNDLKHSKLWDIPKKDIIKIDYFNKMLKFNNNNKIILSCITEQEFQFIYNYMYHDNFDNYITDLDIDDLFKFIKLSNYLLIDDLLKKLKYEFLQRLTSDTLN